MPKTRTPGIAVDAAGNFFIDKLHHGQRIGLRLGPTTLERAEERLLREVEQLDIEAERKRHARPLFRDCAAMYLAQRGGWRSLASMQVHIRLLLPHIGHLPPQHVHDATLAPFISDRIALGSCATTINRSLEIVRTILNRAARSYRDPDGTPWLSAAPPLITMLLGQLRHAIGADRMPRSILMASFDTVTIRRAAKQAHFDSMLVTPVTASDLHNGLVKVLNLGHPSY